MAWFFQKYEKGGKLSLLMMQAPPSTGRARTGDEGSLEGRYASMCGAIGSSDKRQSWSGNFPSRQHMNGLLCQSTIEFPQRLQAMIEDIKKTLWATADKLRANMDAAEYRKKYYINDVLLAELSK